MNSPRWFVRHLAPSSAQFSTSTRIRRDLTAKYRYRPPPVSEEKEEYITASTIPVISSIQDVLPPEPATVTLEKTEEAPFVGRKATPLPAMQPLHQEQPKKEQPRSKEIHVAGVIVPPRPNPPESDECCMSGCVNCVYTLYADDLLAYNESLASALSALRATHTPPATWPAEIRSYADKGRQGDDSAAAAFGKGRAADGGAGRVTRDEIMRDVLEDVDPALRAFLELENKIKARH